MENKIRHPATVWISENKIKRPAPVWIAQTMLVLLALMFLPTPVIILLLMPMAVIYVPGAAFFLALCLGTVGFLLITCWGMARRRQYGRWFGVGILCLTLAFLILKEIGPPSGGYENNTRTAAGFITQGIICGFIFWLILNLAFGKRSIAFFSDTDIDSPRDA
jgi:hypothetical protein